MKTKFIQVVDPATLIQGIVDERRPMSLSFEGRLTAIEPEPGKPPDWSTVAVVSGIVLMVLAFGFALTYTLQSFLQTFHA